MLSEFSLIGRADVPVGAGAESPLAGTFHHSAQNIHGESGLSTLQWEEPTLGPDERGALKLMADILETSTEPLTVIPTGPLTNIATFLEEQPHLKDNIERIVLMGGSVGLGNATPAAEFNIYVDPEAARVVFESGLPITMVGLEAGRKAAFGPEEVEHLRSLGRLGNVTADIVASYAGLYKGSVSP
jgi:pyrimidine-specific ribonucleoside hydrolase